MGRPRWGVGIPGSRRIRSRRSRPVGHRRARLRARRITLGPKSGVWGKDFVIPMAMDAWWRNEPGQAMKQLEGREEEEEDGPAVGRGSAGRGAGHPAP